MIGENKVLITTTKTDCLFFCPTTSAQLSASPEGRIVFIGFCGVWAHLFAFSDFKDSEIWLNLAIIVWDDLVLFLIVNFAWIELYNLVILSSKKHYCIVGFIHLST